VGGFIVLVVLWLPNGLVGLLDTLERKRGTGAGNA